MILTARPSLIALALTIFIPARAFALEPVRPGQEDFLKGAAFADGRLWVLSDAGVLSSLAPGDSHREAEPMTRPVLEMCVASGRLVVVTYQPGASPAWALRRRDDLGWTEIGSVAIPPSRPGARNWAEIGKPAPAFEALMGLACTESRPILVTNHRLVVVGEGGGTIVLDRKLPLRPAHAVLATANAVFLGESDGEWGGGLYRLDRKTGATTTLLQANVNAVTPEPWRAGCLVVAIGVIHFEGSGRLDEVCPDAVGAARERTLVTRPWGGQARGTAVGSLPFYALAPLGDRIVAAAPDGLYDVSRNGVERRPMPALREVDGIGVSFARPDVVVVRNRAQSRRAISGPTPLVLPRR